MHLEQYLLSLYRKAFDQQSIREKPKRQLRLLESISCRMELPQRLLNETSTSMCREKLDSSSVYRSHSALSYRSAKKPATLARALDSFHSQSLCFLEVPDLFTKLY